MAEALLLVGIRMPEIELSSIINSSGLRTGSGVNGGKTGALEAAALLVCGMTRVTGLAAGAAAVWDATRVAGLAAGAAAVCLGGGISHGRTPADAAVVALPKGERAPVAELDELELPRGGPALQDDADVEAAGRPEVTTRIDRWAHPSAAKALRPGVRTPLPPPLACGLAVRPIATAS